MGAHDSPGGKSIICLHSTVHVAGKTLSTIVAGLPRGTPVSTPRQHVQLVVTEYGVANIGMLTDAERSEALIAIAHPDFQARCAPRPPSSARSGPRGRARRPPMRRRPRPLDDRIRDTRRRARRAFRASRRPEEPTPPAGESAPTRTPPTRPRTAACSRLLGQRSRNQGSWLTWSTIGVSTTPAARARRATVGRGARS